MNIGIIGVGRLGLAYALVFEQKKFTVFASSYKKDYVDNLKLRKTDTPEPGIADMLTTAKNIHFTIDNHEIIDNCNLIYVMVATPSTPKGDYDVSAVIDVANDILNHPNDVAGKILVIGSTVNPGTCQQVQDLLDSRGVHVAYSPTFVAQGTVVRDIQNPHTLSIGTTNQNVARQCQEVFSTIIDDNTPIYIMNPVTAEILKLAGNCRAIMNISFFNMIGQVLLNCGLEKDMNTAAEYLNFIKINHKFKFGFGYGGPCYPRDNRAFIQYTQEIGMDYPLGELLDNFNQDHIEWLTNYFIKNNSSNLPFYFSYVSYKKGVTIFEESHQLAVCRNLLHNGHTVYIELSEFLLPKIQQDLSNEFTNTVKFVKLSDIGADNVYNIDI
jgi:nucleotide sugar dehydrogenase